LIVALVAVLVYFASGSPDRLDAGDKLASICAVVLAAATLVLTMSPVRPVVVSGGLDDLTAADLAGLVERQRAQEAAVRLLRRPQPLMVRWLSTWQASAPAVEVFGAAASTGEPPSRGDITNLAPVFRGLHAGSWS
jgi:hypothetical protein